MTNKKTIQAIDKFIVILFFISITIILYNSSRAQSSHSDRTVASIYILFFPFGVAFLQLLRTITVIGRCKADALCRSWIYIFIYYLFTLFIDYSSRLKGISYNIAWSIICPPVAWWYFSSFFKIYPSLKDTIISLSFWFLLVFSFISLYFIPRSLLDNGNFASLNTGYYVLCLYPLALLNSNKIKKIVATVLMFIVVLLSMKRGGYVAMGLAVLIYFLFSSTFGFFKKLLIVGVVVGALFYIIPIVDELTNGTMKARYEFSQNRGDEEGRIDMFPKVWGAVWDSSIPEIMVGHGHNAVASDKIVAGNSAHNDYLEFLYDYGIIGFSLLLFYQWNLLLITIRAYKKGDNLFATIFAFSIVLVLSMVSILYSFYYFLIIIPFWCILNRKDNKVIGI